MIGERFRFELTSESGQVFSGSGYVISINNTADFIDVTSLGNDYRRYSTGLMQSTIEIRCDGQLGYSVPSEPEEASRSPLSPIEHLERLTRKIRQ